MLERFGAALLILFLFFSPSHASEDQSTAIRFGLKSTIYIPTELLSNAKIIRNFNPDSLLIIMKEKSALSITPLSRETLELSEEFNLREFPEYAFMLKSPVEIAALTESDRKSVAAFSSVFGSTAEGEQVEFDTLELESGLLYTRCGQFGCHNFLSESSQNEEILMLESSGMDNSIVPHIISGAMQSDY